jgi:hypothetical protein
MKNNRRLVVAFCVSVGSIAAGALAIALPR